MSDKAVKQIAADDLRRMEDQEGLVLQGCGGDSQEWVDGINGLLTEAGILLDGSKFPAEKVSVFQHGGLTNMLFPFEDVKLNGGLRSPHGRSVGQLNQAAHHLKRSEKETPQVVRRSGR